MLYFTYHNVLFQSLNFTSYSATFKKKINEMIIWGIKKIKLNTTEQQHS